MKSITATTPASVVYSVSKTKVLPRYRRVTEVAGLTGASNQCPFSGAPNSPAKHAGESNLGAHHQSMEPALSTKATVPVSPIMA